MTERAREEAAKGGITPLDFMLSILRDEQKDMAERFEAAKAAAPYMHARLAAVEHSGEIATPNVARLPVPARDAKEWTSRRLDTSMH